MFEVAPGDNEPLGGKGPEAAQVEPALPWYAVWTHSHCEQLVNDQLAAKGFDVFLPRTLVRTPNTEGRGTEKPLFPGYLFLRHAIDKHSYVEVMRVRGVVRILGDRWDALAPIPHDEIESVRQVLQSGAPCHPHAHLTQGDRVRISAGPLAGVSGIFVRNKATKGLLVLSIDLLRRSVAVEVASALVEVI